MANFFLFVKINDYFSHASTVDPFGSPELMLLYCDVKHMFMVYVLIE